MVKRTIFLVLVLIQGLLATVVTVDVNPGDVLDWSTYSNLGPGDTLNIVLSDPMGEVQVLATGAMDISTTIQCNGKLRLTTPTILRTQGTVTAPQIILEATDVMLLTTSILDASGSSGGGNIYVGGGWQGNDPSIKNAKNVGIAEDAQISASATVSGPGGIVVLWADIGMIFEGKVSATALGLTASGGDVEISGKRFIYFGGDVDVSAQSGMNGELLLDPVSVVVQAAMPDIDGNGTNLDMTSATQLNNATTTPTGFPNANSIITAGALQGLLATSNVTLAAQSFITFNAPVTSANTLTLSAPTLNLNQPITGGTLVGQNVTTINVGPFGNAQNGIDLAINGTTVNLATATYPAQLQIISKNITLNGNGAANTIVQVNGAVSSFSSRNPAIYVQDSLNTIIQNLTVNGQNIGFPVNPSIVGIFFVNAGGSVLNTHITQIANSAPPYGGGQQGNGIRAVENTGGPFFLTLDSNTIDHFQKAGIVINGSQVVATVTNNTIQGLGVVSSPAAIGIQLAVGAMGTISGNAISGLMYTDHSESIGILAFSAGNNVTISNNALTNNDEGILSQTAGDGLVIEGNTVQNSGDTGILILDAFGSTQISSNTLSNNGGLGVPGNPNSSIYLFSSTMQTFQVSSNSVMPAAGTNAIFTQGNGAGQAPNTNLLNNMFIDP